MDHDTCKCLGSSFLHWIILTQVGCRVHAFCLWSMNLLVSVLYHGQGTMKTERKP